MASPRSLPDRRPARGRRRPFRFGDRIHLLPSSPSQLDKAKALAARLATLSPGSTAATSLAAEVADEARSLEWQLAEVDKAVAVAEASAHRFNLSAAEVADRRAWVRGARAAARALAEARPASARAALLPGGGANGASSAPRPADPWAGGAEEEAQAQMIRSQDAQLDHLSNAVHRIGEVGLAIHGELESQAVALDELAADTDATGARLAAARRKVATVLERAGVRAQIAIIAGLVVMLVVLSMVAFS